MADSDDYWAIDIPGLTADGAERLVAFAREELGMSGWATDPSSWLTVHLDAETVRPIVDALERARPATGERVPGDGVREGFSDWLKKHGH